MSTAAHEPATRFNTGVYSLREAARLVRMQPGQVSRLVRGYEYTDRRGTRRAVPPLFKGKFVDPEGVLNLSFLDLIEVLFVRAFQEAGVSRHVIRRAAEVAAEIYEEEDHPFCMERFSTDGKRIFATAAGDEGDEHMIDLIQNQFVFREVIQPFFKDLYYEAGHLRRWFPLGKDRPVFLDPRFAFGAPIVESHCVPTRVLYAAHKAGDTEKEISDWFDVPVPSVRAAIEFESGLEQKAA